MEMYMVIIVGALIIGAFINSCATDINVRLGAITEELKKLNEQISKNKI